MQTRIIYVEQSEKSIEAANTLREKTLEYFDNVELSKGVWKDDINIDDYKFAKDIFGGQKGSEGRLNIAAEVATFLSHRKCWEECVASNEYMLILEDDTFWMYPPDVDRINHFYGQVLNLGIPNWGTPIGRQYKSIIMQEQIVRRAVCDYQHNIKDIVNDKCTCDNINLFGAHSYIISPQAAKLLIDDADKNGIMPADVFIRQEVVTIYDMFPLMTNQLTYSGNPFSNIVN